VKKLCTQIVAAVPDLHGVDPLREVRQGLDFAKGGHALDALAVGVRLDGNPVLRDVAGERLVLLPAPVLFDATAKEDDMTKVGGGQFHADEDVDVVAGTCGELAHGDGAGGGIVIGDGEDAAPAAAGDVQEALVGGEATGGGH
jgi:hypothetical protein